MEEKRRILVIDDDQVSCIAIVKQLAKYGYHVSVTSNPLEATKKIEEFRPDLILLDIVMPQLSGLELLKKIRQSYSTISLPILMLSGNKEETDIIDALAKGANDYLTKPINIRIAEARITTALNTKDAATKIATLSHVNAVNAMVITYNHEINNPLAIAQMGLALIKKNHTDKNIDRVENALQRITDIVIKIKNLADKEAVEFESYAGTTPMVKLED